MYVDKFISRKLLKLQTPVLDSEMENFSSNQGKNQATMNKPSYGIFEGTERLCEQGP